MIPTIDKLNQDSARVISRRETVVSPWVKLAEKAVQFSPNQEPQIYHAVAQADYITILAVTPDGRIPIVRQFRPAVEQYTWELPAGLLEPGEAPEETCRRELKEEAGLDVRSITPLISCFADTGRMENRQHAFVVEASEPDPLFVPESGITVDFVALPDLIYRIRSGQFHLQLHVGVVLLHGLLLSEKNLGVIPDGTGQFTPSTASEPLQGSDGAMPLNMSLARALGRNEPLTEAELSDAMMALSRLLDSMTGEQPLPVNTANLPAAVRPLLLYCLEAAKQRGDHVQAEALKAVDKRLITSTAGGALPTGLRRRLATMIRATVDANRRSTSLPSHHWIFDHFTAFSGAVPADMNVCYAGTRTRNEFWCGPTSPTIPELHEEYFEWIDILQAVHEAGSTFTMLELGAGFGRWTSRAALAARQKGISKLRLGLAEAEPVHVEWLKRHMADNGISVDEYHLFEAAVAGTRGEMVFAVSMPEGRDNNNPAAWYGQGMMSGDTGRMLPVGDYHGHPLFKRADGWKVIKVPQITFSDILAEYDFVDLADLDIQGLEAEAIEESIDELSRKVRRLHIGTHGTEIEERLAKVLSSAGWICLRDYPLQQENDTYFGRCWFNDGVQSWINPRLTD